MELHNHQHLLKPDPIMATLTARLGWQQYVVPVQGQMIGFAYAIPETPLREVARHVAQSIESRDVRVIGDPNLPVRRVGIGAHKLIEILKPLQTNDAVLMSEPQDCDAFPYRRDGIALGLPHPKGLIAIPHERFEEWAEQDAPAWLKPLVPEVPIEFISAGHRIGRSPLSPHPDLRRCPVVLSPRSRSHFNSGQAPRQMQQREIVLANAPSGSGFDQFTHLVE